MNKEEKFIHPTIPWKASLYLLVSVLENADTQLVNATTKQNELLFQYLQEASIC